MVGLGITTVSGEQQFARVVTTEDSSLLSVASPCPGDCNVDSQRDIRDVVFLIRHLLATEPLEGAALANADVNLDGEVSLNDLVHLFRHRLGLIPLPDCQAFAPAAPPRIRLIAPQSGRSGAGVTLIGAGFSSLPAENVVVFESVDALIQAPVTSASTGGLNLQVPDLVNNHYAVSVRVNGDESNAVGFDVRDEAPELVIRPDLFYVLLPPGSGRDTAVVGGGTPPYRLKPLSAEIQERANVQLDGSIISVEALIQDFETLRLEVEDSANAPNTARTRVNFHFPEFEPTFEITPHTLLADSEPGFRFRSLNNSRQVRMERIELDFENVQADLSGLEAGRVIGISRGLTREGRLLGLLQLMMVSERVSDREIRFDIIDLSGDPAESSADVVGQGSIQAGPAQLTLEALRLPPESLNGSGFNLEWFIDGGIFRLPGPNQPFKVTGHLKSVSVFEGQDLPLRRSAHQSFVTQELPAFAPRVERVIPIHGGVGRTILIRGSGFDPTAENNSVSLAGPEDTRIEAAITSASENELEIVIPPEAASGPLRVATSPDYARTVGRS